ncbi:MAG: superoxide dismutase family protein [Bacteroidales bacterium]
MKGFKTIFSLIIIFNLLSFGCQMGKQGDEADFMVDNEAFALLSPSSGSSVNGKARFTQVGEQTVNMVLEVENIDPGKHAVHLHEKGDCSAPDATSAGEHWNPTGEKHGKREAGGQYHKGDINNFMAEADSTAHFEVTIHGWTIGGADSTNIVGKAVIIHADADDFTSQPSGAAGARIACGVIEEKNGMGIY